MCLMILCTIFPSMCSVLTKGWGAQSDSEIDRGCCTCTQFDSMRKQFLFYFILNIKAQTSYIKEKQPVGKCHYTCGMCACIFFCQVVNSIINNSYTQQIKRYELGNLGKCRLENSQTYNNRQSPPYGAALIQSSSRSDTESKYICQHEVRLE